MAEPFPEFQANVRFLQFLRRVHEEQDLLAALVRKDFSLVNTVPGLSEQERNFIKMCNWEKMEIVPDPELEPITTEAGTVCERRVDPRAVERRCWRT